MNSLNPFERTLAEQDEFGKTFLFYRSHPSLGESIQIWAARRKAETPHALGRQHVVKRRAELRVPTAPHATGFHNRLAPQLAMGSSRGRTGARTASLFGRRLRP